MEDLSGSGSCHKVLVTSYYGQDYVLKLFDLSVHTGIAAFLKEVVLHQKLKTACMRGPL